MTKFTVKSHLQGQVWVSTLDKLRKATLPMIFIWGQGGTIVYGSDQLEAVKIAITEFSKVTDTNATLLPAFSYSYGEVCPSIIHGFEAEIMTCLAGYPGYHYVL